MDSRMSYELDRYITGNWGEDSAGPDPVVVPIDCGLCGFTFKADTYPDDDDSVVFDCPKCHAQIKRDGSVFAEPTSGQ